MKLKGLTRNQIKYRLREIMDISGIDNYDGGFVLYCQPLFGKPYDQYDEEWKYNTV